MLGSDRVDDRLRAVVNQFSYKYNNHCHSGALAQLWVPREDDNGRKVLSTQDAPYAVVGSSDDLAMYRCMLRQYQPPCDGSDAACSISRVFANLRPELSGDVGKKTRTEFDRSAEAQRCNIHSNLLLAIFDEAARQPCAAAVFELAQHEVDVDFDVAVKLLSGVAKAHGFWIPQLQSALNVDSCEVPLESSAAAVSMSTNTAAAQAPAGQQHDPRLRRSSCLIVRSPLPVSEDDSGLDPDGNTNELDAAQQDQQGGGSRRTSKECRQAVIVTDYYHYDPSADDRCRSRRASLSEGPVFETDSAAAAELDAAATAASDQHHRLTSRCSVDASAINAAARCAVTPSGDPWGRFSQVEESWDHRCLTGAPGMPQPDWRRPHDEPQQRQSQSQHPMSLSRMPSAHLQDYWGGPPGSNSIKTHQRQQQPLGQSLGYAVQQQRQPEQDLHQWLQYSQQRPDHAYTQSTLQGQPSNASSSIWQQPFLFSPSHGYSARDLHPAGSLQASLSDADSESSRRKAAAAQRPVRALVARGGSFRPVGVGGMWNYVGGAQKLMAVPRAADIHQMQAHLTSQGAEKILHSQCKLKYALPGSSSATTYIDLETQEDVENMWDEWDEYVSCHPGQTCKLQLYVEAPGSSASSMAGSTDGRGSGGSDTSSIRLQAAYGLKQPAAGMVPVSSLQPPTPSSQSSFMPVTSGPLSSVPSGATSGSAAAANTAADRVAALHLVPVVTSAEAVLGVDLVAQSPGQGDFTLVPFFSSHVSGEHTVADAGGSGNVESLLDDDDDQFVTCANFPTTMDTLSSLRSPSGSTPAGDTAGFSAPAAVNKAAAAAAAQEPAGPPNKQDSSNSNSTRGHGSHGKLATHPVSSSSSGSSTSSRCGVQVHSTGSIAAPFAATQLTTRRSSAQQKQEQLTQIVQELEGRLEVIMPMELDIVRFLGGGAFGEVYLARWHGTEVAVKCLSPTLITAGSNASSSPCTDAVAELMKEAGMLASLHHPNIVAVFGVVLPPTDMLTTTLAEAGVGPAKQAITDDQTADVDIDITSGEHSFSAGTAGGSERSRAECCASVAYLGRSALQEGHPPAPAVVTEYLSAGSLRNAISNKAEWLKSGMAKAKLMLDTARGLDYLHSKRLVHFDLKSANLLVTIRDKVPVIKVADFGLTKQRRQTFVTGINSLRGTLPWIAPEIIKNPESVTEKADIYSFGVIMWEIWTGQEPFEGVHLHVLLHQLTSPGGLSLPVPGTPGWPASKASLVEPAPGWAALMRKCWQTPQDRPTSRQLVVAFDDMMDALRMRRRPIDVHKAGGPVQHGSG